VADGEIFKYQLVGSWGYSPKAAHWVRCVTHGLCDRGINCFMVCVCSDYVSRHVRQIYQVHVYAYAP
jgi:hypothetical protein